VLGVPMVDAAHAAATTPARRHGIPTGALEPGLDADLVVLDDSLAVTAVMVQGAWVAAPAEAPA
jgi:N-acetylglucosamine-6-phosphate deacetylase